MGRNHQPVSPSLSLYILMIPDGGFFKPSMRAQIQALYITSLGIESPSENYNGTYRAEEVIGHPNHHLRISLNA